MGTLPGVSEVSSCQDLRYRSDVALIVRTEGGGSGMGGASEGFFFFFGGGEVVVERLLQNDWRSGS